MQVHSQYSEPLPQASRRMFPLPLPPGELEGQGRDIGAQEKLLPNHPGTFLGGRGNGVDCMLKALVTWD